MSNGTEVFLNPSEDVKKAKKKVDEIREDIDSTIERLSDIVLDNCEESEFVKDEYKEDMEDALLHLKKAKRKMRPPEE